MLDGHASLADRFLHHLRAKLASPGVAYAEPPSPIRGGYDTQIFSFRLERAPASWSMPLILRLLPPQHDPRRALREAAVQDGVAKLGFPAPPVLDVCGDPAPLGGGFLVMERVAGRPMLEAQRTGIARVMLDVQWKLHALDPGPVLEAMGDAGGREAATFDGLLAQLSERVARRGLDGLAGAMSWLLEHRPGEAQVAICHGDLHPQNIMMSEGKVTGVLDWPNSVVADPAYDVASTRVIVSLVPVGLTPMPAVRRAVIALARRVLVGRYMAGYQRLRPIDPRILRYYEAAACMRHLVRVWDVRLAAAAGRAPLGALDASRFGARLAARFSRISGIRLALPPGTA